MAHVICTSHAPAGHNCDWTSKIYNVPTITTPMSLARYDQPFGGLYSTIVISTPMSLARHDVSVISPIRQQVFSTPMPLARHDRFNRHGQYIVYFSTPMPLARHDRWLVRNQRKAEDFYSHASCEAWQVFFNKFSTLSKFLLPCLLRGMTGNDIPYLHFSLFLLPCLLRGMTRQSVSNIGWHQISTPMPLARHDDIWQVIRHRLWNFYSHASCEAWRA